MHGLLVSVGGEFLLTFHTRSANETVVAAGVLLITIYLQAYVLYTLTLLGQLINSSFKSTCHCNNLLYYLSIYVMSNKIMFNRVYSTRSEWQLY